MRRLDIGIASYGNPNGLARTIQGIVRHSTTDWRLLVVVNPHPTESIDRVIGQYSSDARIQFKHQAANLGYVGAVNEFLFNVDTPYALYCDHDITIHTHGWDEKLAALLDREPTVGMAFPNGGPYQIPHDGWQEILWGVGCCWMLRRAIWMDTRVGMFDKEIGHHEEVDYQTKVRLAGYLIGSIPSIHVGHEGRATNDPKAQERISAGVVRWVTKWESYFGGRNQTYHSQNVLRHELWPPTALYLERYFQRHLPHLNDNPETIVLDGKEYDLIKVPRLKGYYRHRII